MAPDIEAIDALTELGLTEYESRCFVALSQLSQGTAKEISRVADVPQSRVYDVTDQLHQRGLIDIEESDPRRYYALPSGKAIDRLHREYSNHLNLAGDALDDLESRDRDDDGAWTIASREDVITRLEMHIGNAADEVYLHVAHEDLLGSDVFTPLEAANERGVTTYLEVPAEELESVVHDRLPATNVAVSELSLGAFTGEERSPGRLLMVDQKTVLLSAQRAGLLPNEVDETGLWGSEVGHGLVAWMRPLLVSRIDRQEFTTGEP